MTWNDRAAVATVVSAVISVVLTPITAISAIVALKAATIAQREFESARRPLAYILWGQQAVMHDDALELSGRVYEARGIPTVIHSVNTEMSQIVGQDELNFETRQERLPPADTFLLDQVP